MLNIAIDEPIGLALSWTLTYLIHSTILISAVWLICRGIRPLAKRVGPGAANLGWKLALVGGFATATVQVAAGVSPVLGALELETGPKLGVVEQAQPTQTASEVRTAPGEAPTRTIVITRGDDEAVAPVAPIPSTSTGAPVTDAPSSAAPPVAATTTELGDAPLWPKLLLGAWALGMMIALIRLARGVISLRRQLKGRREVIEDPVLETFLTLCRDADVRRKIRLTASPNISSPMALWRREIVVPERAVEELSPAAMRSVLAHELAHLERRDPHWLALAAVIEALCFFQPLNRLARRGMQESAELLCDDWAIGRTGDGVQFAKSLAELASWTEASRSSVLVAGMISSQGPLVHRVRRALEGDPRRFTAEEGLRPTRLLLGLGALSALIMIAPGAVEASPPGEVENADKQSRRDRKAASKAESKASKAEDKARKAQEKAEKAQREAEQALREAEQAKREAERAMREVQRGADIHSQGIGRQHIIIRDGDDELVFDGKSLRVRGEGGEVVITDGQNPRVQVKIHDGEFDMDIDVDLESIEDIAGIIAGELFGGGEGFVMPPHPPQGSVHPHPPGVGSWGQIWGQQIGEMIDEEALEREFEERAREFEERARELEERFDPGALEREFEERARELEERARELEERMRERERHRSHVPSPAPTPTPVAPAPPAPATAPLIPA